MNEFYTRASRSAKDLAGEKAVADYLDKYFYSTFSNNTERYYDKETQYKGIDLSVTGKTGDVYVIDEKAAVGYANKGLRTFAQEITSRYTGYKNPNKGKIYNGWAISKTKNDYYVFVWIPECKTTGVVTKSDDIIAVDVALVNKKDLFDWYHSKGITATKLLEKSNSLRYTASMYYDWWKYESECTNATLDNKGYKYHINTKDEENSVNILISKDILMKDLATYSVHIKNGKIE